MANLTIRNLDDKVVERLKKKAKENGLPSGTRMLKPSHI